MPIVLSDHSSQITDHRSQFTKKSYLCNMKCNICPRNCNANRTDTVGFCHAKETVEVSAVCIHKGEEPPICGKKGICNVFFAHCNLQCIYCQNHEISLPHSNTPANIIGIDAIVDKIAEILPQTENIVGFVTPTHYADSIPSIVEALHARGLFPTTVYNCGGYEKVDTLKMLAPYIDIYLPDFKYMDSQIANQYSHAPDYPEVAIAALKEMYNQKGSSLPTDDNDMAYRGIIIRHLVLPGHVENSKAVLDAIADISSNLHVALMAQYYPPLPGLPDPLSRPLLKEEYDEVADHFYAIGLHKGWVQELEAQTTYRPDFSSKNEIFRFSD